MIFLMHIALFSVLCLTYFFTACSYTLWMCVRGSLLSFPTLSPCVCVFFSPTIHLHQSIFMFPLSFSSSSSLSSIPPSLDSISELDHGLSDISEDEDLIDDTTTSHALWTLPSNASSPFSDMQLADLEHLAQNPPASYPITSSQTRSSELLGVEGGCKVETRAGLPNWWSWFSLRGVVKYVSFVLCFLSLLGKNGNRCLPTKFFSGFTKKLSFFTPAVSKLTSTSAGKLKIFTVSGPRFIVSNMTTPRLSQILNGLALKVTHFVAFITSYLPTKFITLVPAVLWHPTRLHLPSISSPTWPPFVSSFSSLSSLRSYFFSLPPSSSLLTLSSLSCSNLTPSIHRYLQNPSPLFLPCLLVTFLLAVMLTASQSLVLALILATPLGLTLCYLENVVSSQRKAVLPMFITEMPDDQSEDQLSSGFNMQASPLTPTHTPPRIRHHTHTSVTWTQEMCDPAA